jgi:hypothetical protein
MKIIKRLESQFPNSEYLILGSKGQDNSGFMLLCVG